MRITQRILILIGILTLLASGNSISMAQDVERPDGWDDYSHSKDTDPVYEIVFPQETVNTITITISPENWTVMQEDMTALFGDFGTGRGFGIRPGGEQDFQPPNNAGPDGDGLPQGFQPPNNGDRGGFPGGGGNLQFAEEDPVWVAADVSFNDETWTNVGIRYKGNSTLSGAWSSGSLKMGFKLNFDKFEDDYPEIDNQRFYGFDEISFSSNYRDSSYLHEKIAADLYREAGIPSAQTAFYAVYMDYGEGPVYIGLYTAVEEIDDTLLDTQFEDTDGNLYKPEGTGADFSAGSFTEAGFEKKTNADEADFSDILALFDALHADIRTTDPAAWRANLEAVFDVDVFLRWLAVNTVIQNWDTYGAMAHNYYLYNDPTTGLLTWIPWDNNEAFTGGFRGGGGGRGGANFGGPGSSSNIDQSNVGNNWPLIRYLIDDPVYNALYVSYVEDTINRVFVPETMTETYQTLHTLIAPYVLGDATGTADPLLESPAAFEASLSDLIDHVNQRYTLVMAFLNNQQAAN